jgi:HEAT repeat protein
MNTVDMFLAVGFGFLILIVVVRIWIGRKRAAQIDPDIKIKKPASAKKTVDSKQSAAKEITDEQAANLSFETETKKDNAEAEAPGNRESLPPAEEEPSQSFVQQEADGEISAEAFDPIVLIKTFSAPAEKRIKAITTAGEQKLKEAVQPLIEVLYEPDATISGAAAEALGKIGDERAIEPLLEIARRNDAQLIREFSENLHQEAEKEEEEEEEGSQEQAKQQKNETENPYNFKEMVVFKIDQLPQEYFQSDGSPIPRKELVTRGLKDNNQQLRQMAAKVAIGLDSEDVVDPLIEALENPYEVESVRFMAAEALGGMNNEKSVESLLKALKDENVAVRYSAAAALSGRKDDNVVLALIGATNDEDKFVRSSVAYALGATGSPQAMQVLFDSLSDKSEVVRFSAAKSLACFDEKVVVEEVNKRLDYADKKTRLALIDILGQLNCDESAKILKQFLGSEDIDVSYKASMALMGREDLEIIDELIEASKRFDQELFSLFEKGAPLKMVNNTGFARKILSDSLYKLKEGLSDTNPNIRGSAANALGETKDPMAVELLLEALNDENEFVRASTVASLGRIASESSLEQLLEKKDDTSEEVRYALVKALSNFSNELAKNCLKKMARSDRSSQVKRAARAAADKK